MKRITILGMLLLAGFSSHAQFSFEAKDDYGRLEGFTYDLETQNKLYAVSINNHIVVSYDNGQTWDLLFAFPDTTARLTNLRMLPGNENLCFSVLNGDAADNAIYLYNVQDGEILSSFGLPAQDQNPSVVDFDIYDSEATTILLNVSVDSGYKVFYTTTGGENWTEVYNDDDYNDISVMSVRISPENPSKLFLARSEGPTDVDGGILISTDAGETWTERLPGVMIRPVDFKPGDANTIIVGTDIEGESIEESLYRSTDGGTTWSMLPATWTDLVLDSFTVIKYHPTNNAIVYALEENEIAYSEDGGNTWQITVYPEDQYYYGLGIAVNPFDAKEAIVTTNMYPIRTEDGGLTIAQVKAPFCTVNSLSSVKFGSTEHLYYSAQGGNLHKDYSTNMTEAYNIESPSTFAPSPVQIVADPYNEGRIFMYEGGFMGANLYVSTDHGATRTQLMSDFASRLVDVAVDPENNNIIYVVLDDWGNSSMYMLDISNTEMITPVAVTTPGDGSIAGILAYPGKLILAKNGTVYTSVNDGADWTELYTVAGAIIADLSANPLGANGFGIATNDGVYTTADNGANWTAALNGVDARKIEFSDVTNGVMAVGVYNGDSNQDAYITYYNGTGWVTVSSEDMNYLQSYAMDFNFIGDNINAYIATVDMGVIRYSFPIETLGTNNPAITANKVVLAPNPASDYVTVHTAQQTDIKNVTIYSITGQKVLESTQPTMNISHLSKGLYVVKAEMTSGATASIKLVKE